MHAGCIELSISRLKVREYLPEASAAANREKLFLSDRTLQSAKFERLLASNAIAIVTATLERIETANDAFLRMLGYSRDELLEGKVSWREITPHEYDHLDDAALQQLKSVGECIPFRKEYIHKSGKRIPIMIGAALLRSDPMEWICFIVDETPYHTTEDALARLIAEKQALLKHKDMLLQEMNHRTKNDLQLLSSFLTLEAKKTPSPEVRTALEEAAGRVAAIGTLHQELYSWSVEAEPDAQSVIRRVCDEIARVHHRRIAIEVSGDRAPISASQSSALSLITNELLTNALKYAGSGSEAPLAMVIKIKSGEGRLQITFSDNGPGFPSGFDLAQARGLGFQVIQALVRQNQGSIVAVPSNLGGARIAISWPAVTPPVALREAAAS